LEESLLQEREPLTRFQGLKKVRKKRLLISNLKKLIWPNQVIKMMIKSSKKFIIRMMIKEPCSLLRICKCKRYPLFLNSSVQSLLVILH